MKIICLFVTFTVFVACKRDIGGGTNTPLPNTSNLTMNIYSSSEDADMTALMTVKDSMFQITSFGSIYGGQKNVTRFYFSDVEEQKEYYALLDGNRRMEFLYEINTYEGTKLNKLTWFDRSEGNIVVRLYDYDWENRLGALKYEAVFENEQDESPEITYDGNEPQPPPQAPLPNNALLENFIVPRKNYTKTQEFRLKINKPSVAIEPSITLPTPISSNDVLDETPEATQREIIDFHDGLKGSVTDGVDLACRIPVLCPIGTSLKNFINSAINNLTNRPPEIDVTIPLGEHVDVTTNDGLNYDIGVYDQSIGDINVVDATENARRHINNVRRAARNGIRNGINTFKDWWKKFVEEQNVPNEALNDLSDSKGVMQFALTWVGTDGNTDLDLHVEDPFNEVIYFEHKSSASGGQLDRDDVTGPGPENIFWNRAPIPDGIYTIKVHFYSGQGVRSFKVVATNGLGTVFDFPGVLIPDQMKAVAFVTRFSNGAIIEQPL